MVDIGANVGDTPLVMLSHGATKVLAIEPSDRYRALLQHNVPEAVVIDAVLGTGDAGRGEPWLRRDDWAGTVDPALRRAGGWVRAAGSVKVDTDGMDQSIWLADLDWLARVKPALFVEYAPDLIPNEGDRVRFFGAMQEIGYGWLRWYDEQGRFLLSTTPQDTRIVGELADHFRGGGTRHYADIGMFAKEPMTPG